MPPFGSTCTSSPLRLYASWTTSAVVGEDAGEPENARAVLGVDLDALVLDLDLMLLLAYVEVKDDAGAIT